MNPKRSQRYDDGHAEPNDPTDTRSCPFDWEELERAMGEAELGPVEYEQLAFAIGQVMRWMLAGHPGRRGNRDLLRMVGIRCIALAWVVNPDAFVGRPSLRALAKRYRIDRNAVSKAAARASVRFDMANAEQHHQHLVVTRERVHHAFPQRPKKALKRAT